MLTTAHCIACGKILRIDPEKEQAMCPKCLGKVHQPGLQQKPELKDLALMARPDMKLSVENAIYRLTTESDTKRNLGSYLSCLYKILASAGIRGNVNEWCQRVGADKFHEGVKNNILVQEDQTYGDDMEHRGEGYLIKEQPPQAPVPTPDDLSVDKIIRMGQSTLTAQISYHGQTGLLRIQRLGDREEWTTDNLDMIDPEFCGRLTQIESEMHSMSYPRSAIEPDIGSLKYHLRSKCSTL
jgi:hypothetical protein